MQAISRTWRFYPTFTEEAIASFKAQHGKGPTDFNDLHQLERLAEVERQINNLTSIHGGKAYEWPEPMALITKAAALKYPFDALPAKIREAVEEV